MSKGALSETLTISAPGAELRARSAPLPFQRSAALGGAGGALCAAIGDVPVALDTVRWQLGEALRLTIVMKVELSVDPLEGTIRPAAWAPPLHLADVHFRGQPTAHVLAASDRVPWKRNVDVTLLGHARTAFGRALPEVGLSFSAREGETVHFQKRARALGERAAKGGNPAFFITMPVVYERAYGGPATPANPIGTGDDPADPPPNLLDAADPAQPAAFGPIAADWPLRRRKLGALGRTDLEQPVIVLPADFDVSYFQSAPAEQQVAELGPTTRFVLGGFHAERPEVEIGLPQLLPAGAVYGLSSDFPEEPFPVEFRLDTVHIQAHAWLLTLTYRACVELPDEATLERLTVVAGLGMNGHALLLPEARATVSGAARGPREVWPRAPQPPRSDASETLDLPAAPSRAPSSLPFGKLRSPFGEAPAVAALPPEPLTRPLPPAPAPPPEWPAASADEEAPPSSLETTLATAAAPPPPAAPAPPAPAAAPAPPTPAAETPARDPYGQALPWARGAEASEAQAPAKPAPRSRPERKFTLKKGFGKR